MQVKNIMHKNVTTIAKTKTAKDAAMMMEECKIGFVPVEDNDKLIGVVTDRDLTLRILAQGRPASTQVSECIDKKVKYCYEDEDLKDVAKQMSELQVRRMPVMNRDKRLVGVVSIGDLARSNAAAKSKREAFEGVSRPAS